MFNHLVENTKKLFGYSKNKLQEKNRSQVFIRWINDKLKSNGLTEIKTINDLSTGVILISLIEIIWGDKLEGFYQNPDNSKKKIENFDKILKYLQQKKRIEIDNYHLENIVRNKDTKDLLQIIWLMIYNHSVKWITLYGLNGESALLQWCNQFTVSPISNFSENWEDGTLLINIFRHYFPDKIDMNSIELSTPKDNIQLALTKLNEVNAPIYFQPENFKNIDDISVILQCSSLFNFFSSVELIRSGKEQNNGIRDQPDFESGRLSQIELDSIDTTKKKTILQLNQHFYHVFPSRNLVQVAIINQDDDLSIDYKFDDFAQAVRRAGSRPIIFVSCIGRYQQGKSTMISGITGNIAYGIGNRAQEETKGVFIDGPYELDYLYQRFQIEKRDNIYFEGNEILSPLVFFFDIEGYGGIMHGEDISKNNQSFIQMCTPFLCLSSIFIFISEPNASQQEIKELFERMKVSNLTTYSNDSDSNGALSLLILFNKYNHVHPEGKNYNSEELKRKMNEEASNFKEFWSGARPLTNYGIKYDFSMVLESLDYFIEDGSFFDSFQFFVEKIIRSIENATEGSFIRCSQESINLFNYIMQHYNEPLFGDNIKRLIREQHDNSFHTLADRGYRISRNYTISHINQVFEHYCNHLDIEYIYDNIRGELMRDGVAHINGSLLVIQDHPSVYEIINSFISEISQYIETKDNEYQRIRTQKIEEVNSQIEQEARNNMPHILNRIQEVLRNNHNFDYDQSRIDDTVNSFINNLNTHLSQYKEANNLFLLNDEALQQVVSDKKDMLQQQILPVIQREREEEILRQQQEIEAKSTVFNTVRNLLIQHYGNIQSTEIIRLGERLTSVDYYREHYANTRELIPQIQSNIKDEMVRTYLQIITNICREVSNESEEKRDAIQRLTDKGEPFATEDLINDIISSKYQNLSAAIDRAFRSAKEKLAITNLQTRRIPIPIISVSIETKTIVTYPDGSIEEGDWVQIRTEYRNFSEILTQIKDAIVSVGTFMHDIVDPVIQTADAVKKLNDRFGNKKSDS